MNSLHSYQKRHVSYILILKKMLPFLLDIVIAAALVGGDYLYVYRLPQRLEAQNIVTALPSETATSQSQTGTQAEESPKEEVKVLTADGTVTASYAAEQDWTNKFADRFSDTVISTDTVYRSPDIAIEISTGSYDSGIIDHSENGKHEKYGSLVAYTVADIHVSDISHITTAFAADTYGVGFSERLTSMSARIQSVLAVNGDSYSNNRHKDNGTIIRNGIVYRSMPSTSETCVLYRDGSMKIYTPENFDPARAIADGAWQSWVFGPSLLDENGKAKENFLTWDYIRESHPRTAIGYYEPGHYCLVVVDGRQGGYSRGMYLNELSRLFEDMGCIAAYNLDGGHCSFMTKDVNIVTNPYKPQKDVSDGIFICEQ